MPTLSDSAQCVDRRADNVCSIGHGIGRVSGSDRTSRSSSSNTLISKSGRVAHLDGATIFLVVQPVAGRFRKCLYDINGRRPVRSWARGERFVCVVGVRGTSWLCHAWTIADFEGWREIIGELSGSKGVSPNQRDYYPKGQPSRRSLWASTRYGEFALLLPVLA